MNAAVVKARYKKSDLEKAVKDYKDSVLPAISTHEGARSAVLLVNRETGDGISIAFYENEAAAKSFAPKAEKLIASLAKYMEGGTTPKRELYEVATGTQTEAKAVVERGTKAFNAHDLEAIARESSSDSEMTAPGDVKLKGPQAIKEYNQNFITAFPDARTDSKNIFTHQPRESQTVLPTILGSLTNPAAGSFTPTGAFGWNVDGEKSVDSFNTGDINTYGRSGHAVRFYPVRDRSGNLIPNTWLIGMDYENGTFDNRSDTAQTRPM